MATIITKLSEYGSLVTQGLVIIVGGMIVIFLLYQLITSRLKPQATWARLLKVIFGTLYVLILAISVLIAANRFGYDVSGIAGIAILTILACAAVVFFLIPFLPRLPFVKGDMVEVRGVLGIVEAITAYQILIRTFDGQSVSVPSPAALSSIITNYSTNSARRVAMTITLGVDSDLDEASHILLQLLKAEPGVLADPEPVVLVTEINLQGIQLLVTSWVDVDEWLAMRDKLWRKVVKALKASPTVSLAVPRLTLQESSKNHSGVSP